MNVIGLLLNALLIVLLGAALVSIFRLNRRMAELREGRAAFEKLTADLVRQTDAATGGLAALRKDAETLGKQLDAGSERGRQVIAEVQRASDDLRLLIGRADGASGKLEGIIAQARGHEAAAGALEEKFAAGAGRGSLRDSGRRPEPSAKPAPGREAEEPPSPESAAFLSSLAGMR